MPKKRTLLTILILICGLVVSTAATKSDKAKTVACPAEKGCIDRKAVVMRNNPLVTTFSELNSLTVGNGHFATTVDITGLQSSQETSSRESLSVQCLTGDGIPSPT